MPASRAGRCSRPQLLAASLSLLAAALLAHWLEPRHLMAKPAAPDHLEQMIPRRFGQWSYVPSIGLVRPSAADEKGDVERKWESWKIYSQVVGRGYQDAAGHIVMLMVAYGPVQAYKLKAHWPEVCYTAAGFRISGKITASVPYREGAPPITLTRLTAQRESRLEPVSYWMRVGGAITRGVIDRQILRLKYGLEGLVPDGALIRVSTVGMAPQASFELQDRFIHDLLAAIPAEELPFFVGET
jgi:EpsI family protein